MPKCLLPIYCTLCVIADILARAVNQINADLNEVLQGKMQRIKQLLLPFAGQPTSLTTVVEFGQRSQNIVRQMCRKAMAFTCNE